MNNWQEINRNALHWVKEAGEKIKASFQGILNIQTKSNANDLVTNIDKEIELFFVKKIKTFYPDHSVLGEEGLGDRPENLSGIVWIIDPIDGTVNFIHQQRNFAISVGIYEQGIGKIGLIYDVVNGELFHAEKGQGAYVNGVKIPILEKKPINEAIIGVNSSWVLNRNGIAPPKLGDLVMDVRGTRSYGSAAIEIAYIATGRIDGYITMRLSPWDFAGGLVLLEEVGGIATTLRGEPLNLFETNTIFFAKPGLHQDILEKYLENGNW